MGMFSPLLCLANFSIVVSVGSSDCRENGSRFQLVAGTFELHDFF